MACLPAKAVAECEYHKWRILFLQELYFILQACQKRQLNTGYKAESHSFTFFKHISTKPVHYYINASSNLP